jgi:energy-coupling factor transporter transmembrane protein EcfT
MNIKKLILSNKLTTAIIILAILTLILLGINILSIIIITLYILFYLTFISKQLTIKIIKLSYQWIVLGIIILLSLTILFTVNPKNKNNSKTKALTPEQCKPIYDEYNETILDITGKGLKGSVAIKINPENCEANVYYNFLTTMNLEKNYSIPNSGYSEYYYAAYIREEDASRDQLVGTTQLSPVFTNKTSLPTNLYSYGGTEEQYNTRNVVDGSSSNVFHNSWMSTYTLDEESLSKITSKTVYEAVNGAPFAVVESTGENSWNYSMDSDTACKEGEIVNTVHLTYTER